MYSRYRAYSRGSGQSSASFCCYLLVRLSGLKLDGNALEPPAVLAQVICISTLFYISTPLHFSH